MSGQSLRTVAQLAKEYTAFNEPALRRLIFNAKNNGLSEALVRIGRRIYIDLEAFDEWLESHRDRHGLITSQTGRKRPDGV